MSTLAANNITDAAGTGGPTLSNGLTIGTSVLAAPSGSAPSYTCRAWVNFNGTTNVGGFCTIRASGNVSSVADNGTGDYTVNFTTAMSDANYSVNLNVQVAAGLSTASYIFASNSGGSFTQTNPSTGSFRIISYSNAFYDPPYVCISVFR